MTQKGADKLMSESPILIVPYMWIGDFVRCHTVVKLLKQRFPSAPIDILTTSMVAPLRDAGPAQGGGRAGAMAVAGTQGACLRTRRVAPAAGACARWAPRGCARAGCGRTLQALARRLLRRSRAPACRRGPLDMGGGRTRRKRACRRNRRWR